MPTRSHQRALPVFETEAGPCAHVLLEAFEQGPGHLADAELCLYFDYDEKPRGDHLHAGPGTRRAVARGG